MPLDALAGFRASGHVIEAAAIIDAANRLSMANSLRGSRLAPSPGLRRSARLAKPAKSPVASSNRSRSDSPKGRSALKSDGCGNSYLFQVHPMTPPKALLLIDLQNDYYPGGAYELEGMAAASAKSAEMLDRFRSAGSPLIHIRHEFASAEAPFFRPGSEGAIIHESVAPLAGEAVITKQLVNSFQGTDLDARLMAMGVEDLVIVGAMSHMCIEGATRAAADLGYRVEVIHDACATRAQEFGGRRVAAADVHATSMSALGFAYAKVLALKDWK